MISMILMVVLMTAQPEQATPDLHVQSTVHYTQVGKDCVVSQNGSARVARNTKCPKR